MAAEYDEEERERLLEEVREELKHTEVKVRMGRIVVDEEAAGALHPDDVKEALKSHAEGHWGQVDAHDRQWNDLALTTGASITSVYVDRKGDLFSIDTNPERTATVVSKLPESMQHQHEESKHPSASPHMEGDASERSRDRMTTADDEKRKAEERLVKESRQYREGRWCLTKEEMADREGNLRRFYTVQFGREADPNGYRFIAAPDLASLKDRLRGAIQQIRNEREQSQKNTPTEAIAGRRDGPGSAGHGERKGELWHTVVKVQGINEDGTARLEVYKAAKSPEPLASLCTGGYIPHHLHAEREPVKGDTLDVRVGPGQNTHVNDAVDQFRRGRERGHFHCMGVWTDASSSPAERQTLVKFSNGISHAGRYEDRTVTPTKGQLPGQQWEKLYVVFEKHPELPGEGRVVGFSTDRREAIEMVKTMDRQRQEQGKAPRQANRQEPWHEQVNRNQLNQRF